MSRNILIIILSLSFSHFSLAQDDKVVAAGVLPYTVKNDSIFILLGYDDDKSGWTDFGGGREWVSNVDRTYKRLETPEEIAVREFYEECRKVYSAEEISSNFNPNRFIVADSKVYRSYVVKIPYKSREELRNALIPLNPSFSIFNEKTDYYWISLDELKAVILSGENQLPDSPNNGKFFSKFYDTLLREVKNQTIDTYFVR